ncbi:hypothetical protein ACFLSA_04925 [Bacteroidota bacterium]
MAKNLRFIFFTFLLTILSISVNAQCKSFANKICKLELIPYLHDGNYNAAILTEGEDAELYKTFYSGQQYRIAICGSDNLPPVEFKVLDLERNILFDNNTTNFKRSWDFTLESSQQLIIFVKVQSADVEGDDVELISGCVAIMFGIKDI